MPFALTNSLTAPAVFKILINDDLCDMLNQFVFVCPDDILIFLRFLQEQTKHVKRVLCHLLKNHMYVKLKKCEFHVSGCISWVSLLPQVTSKGILKKSRLSPIGLPQPTWRRFNIFWDMWISCKTLVQQQLLSQPSPKGKALNSCEALRPRSLLSN